MKLVLSVAGQVEAVLFHKKNILKKLTFFFMCTLGGSTHDTVNPIKKALLRAETRSKSLEDLIASPGRCPSPLFDLLLSL